MKATLALVLAIVGVLLGGVALGMAFAVPGEAPRPAALVCPTLALVDVGPADVGQRVRLRVRWEGPGAARVRIGDFALLDDAGRLYVSDGDGETLVAGGGELAELTATPAAGARLVEARLDYPGCPPATVELGEAGQ